jgi:hypothetical protein
MLPTPTFEDLKNSGAVPHWFGLGFIQIKLDDRRRMHFWHPDLTADTPDEELHDHRYDFTSRVVLGEITHETFSFHEIDKNEIDTDAEFQPPHEQIYLSGQLIHTITNVTCQPGAEIDDPNVAYGTIWKDGSYTMKAGSEYTFPSHALHRIKTKKAITYLERGAVEKRTANVIRPFGAKTICPFSRTIDTHLLWQYIAELMSEAENPVLLPQSENPGYHLDLIPRGTLGEPSKILEEVLEFLDAHRQRVKVMELVELSDLMGAVKAYLAKHAPDHDLDDLLSMSEVTERAFKNGRR